MIQGDWGRIAFVAWERDWFGGFVLVVFVLIWMNLDWRSEIFLRVFIPISSDSRRFYSSCSSWYRFFLMADHHFGRIQTGTVHRTIHPGVERNWRVVECTSGKYDCEVNYWWWQQESKGRSCRPNTRDDVLYPLRLYEWTGAGRTRKGIDYWYRTGRLYPQGRKVMLCNTIIIIWL